MALKVVKMFNSGVEVFAMTEGLATVSYNVEQQSSLSTLENGRYIIKAGTPVPSNDENCVGLVFENWDVTDEGGPIPVAIGGYVKEPALPVEIAAAAKSALKNVVFINEDTFVSADISMEVAPQTAAAGYAGGSDITVKVTLTGGVFVDGATSPMSWDLGLPVSFYPKSITLNAAKTEATIVINSVSSKVPATGALITVGVMQNAINGGSIPAAVTAELLVNA